MPRLILTLSFFAVILGCATTSRFDTRFDKRLKPPIPAFLKKWKNASPAELEKLEVGSREENIQWWKQYTLALSQRTTNKPSACQNFKALSIATDFSLHELALLRAYEVCPPTETLAPMPPSARPWYRELYADIKLQEALETADPKDDVQALADKAALQNNKKSKEELLQKALTAAEKVEAEEDIKKIKSSLYKNSPRLNPEPAMADYPAIAADHRFQRDFEKALQTYQKILSHKKTTDEEQFQTLKNIRQTYKVAQQRNDYISATADLVNWSKKNLKQNKKDRSAIARYCEAQILFAKTLWTEDQTSKAVEVLNETHRQMRGLFPMDEVFFILGRIDEEKGQFEKALEFFEASYKENVTVPGLRDKIAWLKSWNYYKLSKWEEAKNSFEQMKATVKDPTDKFRASFWLGRTLKKLEQNSLAAEEFQRISKEDPLGYYGILATRELNVEFSPLHNELSAAEQMSLFAIPELEPALTMTAEWLIAVGEKSSAEKVLNIAAEDLRKKNVSSENTWLTLSSAYARTGLYLPLFSAIGALPPQVKDRLLSDHPDLLFPQAFADNIKEASNKSGTPEEFIFAIIRQESAFNPEARSSVDAFGLMQLLPSVAQQLAKNHSIPYNESADLLRPEINIPLGAFELKNLMKKYDDQFILAASGYNANAGAIKGWLKTRYRDDSVEFIEEVPYEETRTYIKLVMRNYVFYKRLLNPDKKIAFPESLLMLRK